MKLHKIAYSVGLSLLVAAVAIGMGMGLSSSKRSELLVSNTAWVDDDDPTCGGNFPCFQTIQAAVEAVDDTVGGEVYILAGRYRENVMIKRSVSLIGVGLVRLEALDPKKPTILVSHGIKPTDPIKQRSVRMIGNLEIVGGQVVIEIVDAHVAHLKGNRIVSLNNLLGFFPYPASPTDGGIWVERSIIQEITGNEINSAVGGIVLGEGTLVGSIDSNTIHRTGWGIRLQGDAEVSSIFANDFDRNAVHIVVADRARADYIANNRLLLGDWAGITVTGSAKAIIENNLIDNNWVGIYISCYDLSGFLVNDDSCLKPPGPVFTLARNRIMGNRYGLFLEDGQGKVLRNWISENGYTHDRAGYPIPLGDVQVGAGLLLGRRVQVEVSHNWVVNNTLGAAYGIPLGDVASFNCQWSQENRPFEGKLTGGNNEIKDNEFADLCPSSGLPWPPGFRK